MKNILFYITSIVLILTLSNCGIALHSTKSIWEVCYQAGQTDVNDNFLSGTEIMYLVSHQGKLYAANGFFGEKPEHAQKTGAQILLKQSVEDPWKLENQFNPPFKRVKAFKSVTFTTDGRGNTLPKPVSILIATLSNYEQILRETIVYTKEDSGRKWTKNILQTGRRAFPRAIGQYRDKVTGIDRVFIGCLSGIYTGVYEPNSPGAVRWNTIPELPLYKSRVMAFAECNGDLYAAIKPAIYKRIDGNQPKWEIVYEYPAPVYEITQGSGMRGLTAVPKPDGNGEMLLMALEGRESEIVHLDPSKNYESTVELDIMKFLREQWGDFFAEDKPVIVAANDMTKVVDQKTGKPLYLIGLLAHNNKPEKINSAWYLIRSSEGNYTLREIPAVIDKRRSDMRLMGTRSILVSPFKSEDGKSVYFGGYFILGPPPQDNTAWTYKTNLATALAGYEQ